MTYRNPNVQRLIEQATEHFQSYSYARGNYKETSLDRWKFAELIVRECIDIISPYTVRMGRPGEEYLHPIVELKKHFGIKDEPKDC